MLDAACVRLLLHTSSLHIFGWWRDGLLGLVLSSFMTWRVWFGLLGAAGIFSSFRGRWSFLVLVVGQLKRRRGIGAQMHDKFAQLHGFTRRLAWLSCQTQRYLYPLRGRSGCLMNLFLGGSLGQLTYTQSCINF